MKDKQALIEQIESVLNPFTPVSGIGVVKHEKKIERVLKRCRNALKQSLTLDEVLEVVNNVLGTGNADERIENELITRTEVKQALIGKLGGES